jgi:hypothetical protein
MPPAATSRSMPPLHRAAWVGAFLLGGFVLPLAVQHWVWAPVEVRITNANADHALEGLVVLSGAERVVLGRLGAGEERVVRLRSREGQLRLSVQLPGEPEPRQVGVTACCHAQVQLRVDGARPPQLAALPPSGFWAGLAAP